MFDPLELTPEASMNGTLLADLPGADPAWVGRTPLHLTSLPSLQERALAAGLGASNAESGVAHIVDALGSADPDRAARAAEVVGSLARGLGHLIATLKAAPPAAPYNPAQPDAGFSMPSPWRRAYLSHWAQVERVWLGGGLAAALGAFFVNETRAEVERLGVHDCPVEVAQHADVLGLVGAARSRRQAPPVAVVLDFGGTAVKRAVALAEGAALVHLNLLPSRSAPSKETVQDLAGVAGFLVETIVDTFLEAQRTYLEVDPHVSVSLASYVVGGRAVSTHGSYGSLEHLDQRQLEADLQLGTGAPIRLEFLHDGTAAARGLVQPGRAGLIVLGTYLAAGFPAPADRLAPLAADFFIRRPSI